MQVGVNDNTFFSSTKYSSYVLNLVTNGWNIFFETTIKLTKHLIRFLSAEFYYFLFLKIHKMRQSFSVARQHLSNFISTYSTGVSVCLSL